jgi:hypothetical protein
MTTRNKSSLKAEGKGKLSLSKLTLRDLTVPDAGPRGGWLRPPISWSCPQPPPSSSNCPKKFL